MMKRKGYTVLRYLVALAMAISTLAPMLWLFLTSISTTANLTRVPLEWPPRQWSFSRCGHLLSLAPGKPGALFLPVLGNSLLVAVEATLVSSLLAVPTAFSFLRYPGRDDWLHAGPDICVVPPVAFVLPLYFVLKRFGLLNTHSGLVLVYCPLIASFLTRMVKSQFDILPQDIEQAARLDSLRVWQVLLRITLPLAKLMLDATALFGWLLAWDKFFYALLFTSNLVAQTLPVTITSFTAGHAAGDGLVAAAGILASVPPLLTAIRLQKPLISDLTNGGSRG